MKIKMPSGVILECDNDDINEYRLMAGGVEVADTVKKKSPKKTTEEED